MEEPWQLCVARLSLAGETVQTVALLRSEIERGNLAALVSLARRYHDAQLSHDDAVELVARAERQMARRGLHHIERAAELGSC